MIFSNSKTKRSVSFISDKNLKQREFNTPPLQDHHFSDLGALISAILTLETCQRFPRMLLKFRPIYSGPQFYSKPTLLNQRPVKVARHYSKSICFTKQTIFRMPQKHQGIDYKSQIFKTKTHVVPFLKNQTGDNLQQNSLNSQTGRITLEFIHYQRTRSSILLLSES